MRMKILRLFLVLALVPLAQGEEADAPAPSDPAKSVLERILPGLKITNIGTSEPIAGGGLRITGDNRFQFTTSRGDTLRAEAGVVILEPSKSLITLTGTPKLHLKSHSLIATAGHTKITYRTDTGKTSAVGPHRITLGGLGKKSP